MQPRASKPLPPHRTTGRSSLSFRTPTVVNARYGFLLRWNAIVALLALMTASAFGSQATLTWSDSAGDETGFIVQRSADGVNFSQVGVTAANVTTYVDTGLTASTKYWYTVYATNSVGNSVSSNIAVVTAVASGIPAVTSAGTASGTQGTAFSYSITGSNSPTSYSVTGTLPAGVSVNTGTGVISGTPTNSGTFNLGLNATNSSGTGTAALSITIGLPAQSAPVISSATSASGTLGTAFSYTITASNTPTSYSVTGTLPAGVAVNAATGVISGTPTNSGTFNVTVNATNLGGTGNGALAITIAVPIPNAPVVNSATTASGTTGAAFSYAITASNSPTSYSVTGTLPAGVSASTSTGLISGAPTNSGTFNVTVHATNAGGTGNSALVITIGIPIPNAPVVTSGSTATGTTGSAFSYSIVASRSPTSYSVTGTLPSGVSINSSTGVISGTPTAAGIFTVTVHATNAGGTGSSGLVITINAPIPNAPAITSAGTASGQKGTAFSYSISASNIPTSYSVTGTLPAGVTISSTTGLISGTPGNSGVFNVTINATNAGGTGSRALAISIYGLTAGAPVISSAGSAAGTSGAAFSYSITGSNSPTSYSVNGTLPTGLSLNSSTGAITGSPVGAGTFNVIVGATNATGVGTASLAITIASAVQNAPGNVGTNVTAAGASRLINLSARAICGPGAQTLIVGYVITGGSKSVLVRGIGPTLQNFGVSDALSDPLLQVVSGPLALGSNDDWGGTQALSDAFSETGAFQLAAGSKDSALLETLPAGSYTAQITGKTSTPGVALGEIYDADSGSAPAGRFTNISARTEVGSGNNVLIAGFVVSGNAPLKVLIRGSGPSLTQFGVSGVLAHPKIDLYQGSAVLQSNNGWGQTGELTAAFAQVGAFQFSTPMDSAMLVTLQPGAYTVEVSGANGTTGVALVEIYEMPN